MRVLLLATSLLVPLGVVAVACSSTSSSSASPAEAGAPDAADAAVSCADPASTPDQGCGSLSWSTSPTLSRKRNHHLTYVITTAAGPVLYSIGGYDGSALLANVDAAPLNPDGSVGAFTAQAPLPMPTMGPAGGVVSDGTSNVIVIASGQGMQGNTDLAYSAVVGDDGTVGVWKPAGSVAHPRLHAGAFVSGRTIYVLGGFNNSTVWSDVVSATVAADGTVSAWSAAGALPGPRSHMTVTLVDGYVFLTGGLAKSAYVNPPNLADVSRGTLEPDGTIGEWTPMTPLPTALATHAAFFYGGYLYVGGGVDPVPAEVKGVWRVPVAADHTLGAWETVADLPIARSHVHHLPMLGTHVYSVAGAIDFDLTSTAEVDVGSFL